ncbi:MAG: class II fructose-bisphosphate aldolase [Microbacterium sp.]|uniref:class II fructose-bisphosphate aldolase n=1 Tax=Microbacterium sp. TaxID=51671 RepID=UPI0039E55386
MSLTSTAELIERAIARGGAVPAFNVIMLEHAEAIAAGASSAGAILQISENAVRFHGGDPAPLLLACRAVARAASVPLALHLDHVQDPRLVDLAIRSSRRWGLGSIMVDASRLPYAENVAATTAAAARAHRAGILVEAELGEIGGKDGAHAPGVRTDPQEAAAFADATNVDLLAVAVGSSHAMRERSAAVDTALVERIAQRVHVPLVLHGSSGVPDSDLRQAIGAGMRKVNVGTALNLAATSTLRTALAADPDIVDPRRYTVPVRDAMTHVVARFSAVIA